MPWQPTYTTLAELKSFARIPSSDTTDDAELNFAIEAASRAIDHHCGRQFGLVAAAEARFYTVRTSSEVGYAGVSPNRLRWAVDIDDLQTTTGLLIAIDSNLDGTFATTVVVASTTLLPLNAAPKNRPWQWLYLPRDVQNVVTDEGAIRVTGRWGWTTVPTAIKQATLLQANRTFKRRDSWSGVAGSPEFGNELRLQSVIDPDVAVALENYRRHDWNFA